MWNGLSQQYERLSPEDRRTFDRWMRANAVLGAVLALGILAMAFAGFNAPGPDATKYAGPKDKASNVVARRGPQDRSLIRIKDGIGSKP
jgi:hypothetical protein